MTSDPLADLLEEMSEDLYGLSVPFQDEIEWLRANRDRVLEALGGEPVVYDLEVFGPAILWRFLLGKDQ